MLFGCPGVVLGGGCLHQLYFLKISELKFVCFFFFLNQFLFACPLFCFGFGLFCLGFWLVLFVCLNIFARMFFSLCCFKWDIICIDELKDRYGCGSKPPFILSL